MRVQTNTSVLAFVNKRQSAVTNNASAKTTFSASESTGNKQEGSNTSGQNTGRKQK